MVGYDDCEQRHEELNEHCADAVDRSPVRDGPVFVAEVDFRETGQVDHVVVQRSAKKSKLITWLSNVLQRKSKLITWLSNVLQRKVS